MIWRESYKSLKKTELAFNSLMVYYLNLYHSNTVFKPKLKKRSAVKEFKTKFVFLWLNLFYRINSREKSV